MNQLRDAYHRLSFRARLLALLVMVSLIQGGVAAYTFFQLQAKPAQQRVAAQLDASLRGAAPVIDGELQLSNERLKQLIADPALQQAAETGNWAVAEQLLNTNSDDTRVAYITNAKGDVVAGTRPDVPLVDDKASTSSQLLRGAELLGTVHVPVVIDDTFVKDRLRPYAVSGVSVFVADAEHMMGDRGAVRRPAELADGLITTKLGSTDSTALVQPLLDGKLKVIASMPTSRVAAAASEGRSSLWGFISLLLVLMIGVSFIITRAVGDALRRFAAIARDLANGELGRRIPVTGTDEIATLGNSFNDMAENLQERIESLEVARIKMRRQVDLFGEALANATAIDEMLQSVCALAMESTGGTHARFWIVDADGHFEHAACIGLRPGDADPCGLEKAVTVRNESVRNDGSPSWLVVPARAADHTIIGMLTLVSTTAPFTADAALIAERIAVQAAVAIDNARLHEQLRLQATRDGLTGLPNHRSLQDELTRQMQVAYDGGMPLGVALLDIDNFKRVNDTYGHQIGDEAIKALGSVLDNGIGGMGMAARYGGEEFVVLMPGCDADAACRIADRLREDVTRIEIPLEDGGMLKFTASFGVANVDQQRERVDNTEILHQADTGLYNAKRSGKNRVVLAGPDTTVIEMSEAEKAKLIAREKGDLAAEQAAAAQLEHPAAAAQADPFDLAA